MSPPRDCPVRCTRRITGAPGPDARRILMSPLLRVRPSASTRIPGLVTEGQVSPDSQVDIDVQGVVGNESVGEVELRFAEHQQDLHAARNQPAAGARDMAETLVDPVRSLACGGIPSKGRSAVSPFSSPMVRADNAASKRSSSSVRESDRRPRQPAGSPRPDLGPDQTPAARTLCRVRKQYPLAPIQPHSAVVGSPGPPKMSVTAALYGER